MQRCLSAAEDEALAPILSPSPHLLGHGLEGTMVPSGVSESRQKMQRLLQ